MLAFYFSAWLLPFATSVAVTGLEIACLLWPAASHVSLITGSKGASFVWSSSLIDWECGNWLWLDLMDCFDWYDSSLFLAPSLLFQRLMPSLIDWSIVLPRMALPCLVSIYTALFPCRNGKLSLLSQYHCCLLFPLSLLFCKVLVATKVVTCYSKTL